MEFYATATDIESGKPVYTRLDIGNGPDTEWFRASASMPLLSKPVQIDGRKYLDGGCSDCIPLKFFESIGYDRNIVVLTQPYGYRKRKRPLTSLVAMMLSRYPNLAHDMKIRADRYNETLDYIESKSRKGEVFVVRPPKDLNIGKTEKDPAELERVYRIGRKTAEDQLGDIRSFLQK
jgi:predicted patatin/cPLA2 family phospholipase